jgi:hypothetical protein
MFRESFIVGAANTVMMYIIVWNYHRTKLWYSWWIGGDVQISSVMLKNDGLHIKVNHKNHGMYFTE